jgi:RNA polymerase sigma-70 factor (ECF subfamily)
MDSGGQMLNDENAELIEQVLDGSTNAFDKLMINHQEMVFRIGLQFGKNRENAMDITQNVFLKVYENLKSFQGRSSFKTWLMRIAYNEGTNWIRKNKNELDNEAFDEEVNMVQNSPSQEDEVLAQENRSILLRSLLSLNTRYRLAVVLRYFEDKPLREIAHILNCSEGVVKNMLYRSIQKMKELLPEQRMGGLV